MARKRINLIIEDRRPRKKRPEVEETPPPDIVWPTLLEDEIFPSAIPEIELFDGATKKSATEPGWWDDLDMRPAQSELQTKTYNKSIAMKGNFMGMPINSTIEDLYYGTSVTNPALIAQEFGSANGNRWVRKPLGKYALYDSDQQRYIWAEGQNTVWMGEWDGWSASQDGAIFVNYRCVHNSKSYVCYTQHSKASDKEPGVGENWRDYWFWGNTVTIIRLKYRSAWPKITGL